ncbi:hypothetical protein Tco_1523902 [Tanacetum coccineum]
MPLGCRHEQETIMLGDFKEKTMASAIDLVISLMRQVESKEKAAGKAKAETTISGLDIRLKDEELKQA